MAFGGILKQSTAVDVLLGPFVDSTDGVTAETGLTIAQADVQLSKNGQTMAQKNDATSCSHDANGYYNCELNATDTNTVGQLTVTVAESGALPVRFDFQVMEEATYDALFGASAGGFDSNGRVDVASLAGSAVQQTGGHIHAYDDAGNALPAKTDVTGLNDPTAASIADAVWDEAASGHTSAGTFGEQCGTDIDAILTDTAEIGSAGAGLTAVPWNASWDAEVQSEVQDAIEANHLDHLLAVDYDPAAKPGTATALLNELVENDGGVSRFTENSLEQAPSGTGASAATIADAVWDEAQADHTSAGSFGEIASEIANIEADTNELQTDDVPGLIAGLNDPTAGAVADAVWDEATAGHTTAGTFGEQVKTDVDAILSDTNELQTNQGDWATATGFSTHSAADVVNEWETQSQADPTGFHVNVIEVGGTAQTANDNGADINAILADTNEVQGMLPSKAYLAGSADADGGIDATEAAVINGEVVDALDTDTYDEPGTGAPGATVSLSDKLGYLYKAWRNKVTSDADSVDLYNDDGATVGQTASLNDDGSTFTRGEQASG
jgi:hypothetical protein